MAQVTTEPSVRRLDIQGLRALAVVLVIAFHLGLPVDGGFIGVDVFFTISGYVISEMLLRERSATGSIKLGAFYLRRIKRLMPALAVTIVTTLILAAALFSPFRSQRIVADTGIGAMTFSANWRIAGNVGGYFDAPAASNPLLHTWSLAVEEQFYLVFPGVLVLLAWLNKRSVRAGRQRFGESSVIVALSALSFGLACIGPFSELGQQLGSRTGGLLGNFALGFYSPLTRAWEFGLGAVLALNPGIARVVRKFGSNAFARIIAVSMIILSALFLTDRLQAPGVWTLVPLVGTLVLLVSNPCRSDPVSRLLSSRLFVTAGDLSYSLYLWHWPAIVFAKTLYPGNNLVLGGSFVASVAIAFASFRWVENPIRLLKGSFAREILPVLTGFFVVPVLAAIVIASASSAGFWSSRVRQFKEFATQDHAALLRQCDGAEPVSPTVVSECSWNPELAGPAVYVVGDSNADHFSEGIIQASETLNHPVILSTTNACPFFDLVVVRTGEQWMTDKCTEYNRRSLAFFDTARPAIVVISQAPVYAYQSIIALSDGALNPSTERDRKLALIEQSLLRTVKRLEKAGHQVVLVQAAPWWESWNPDRCSLLTVLAGRCDDTMPASRAESMFGGYRSIVSEIADRTEASVFDPISTLCPSGTCTVKRGEFVRYRDAAHLSVWQSLELASLWQKTLESASLPRA